MERGGRAGFKGKGTCIMRLHLHCFLPTPPNLLGSNIGPTSLAHCLSCFVCRKSDLPDCARYLWQPLSTSPCTSHLPKAKRSSFFIFSRRGAWGWALPLVSGVRGHCGEPACVGKALRGDHAREPREESGVWRLWRASGGDGRDRGRSPRTPT